MIIQENTIIHGDSLTVLRQMEPESVDAIITDPPYLSRGYIREVVIDIGRSALSSN